MLFKVPLKFESVVEYSNESYLFEQCVSVVPVYNAVQGGPNF